MVWKAIDRIFRGAYWFWAKSLSKSCLFECGCLLASSRPRRLVVRTLAFHACNTGSSPVGVIF